MNENFLITFSTFFRLTGVLAIKIQIFIYVNFAVFLKRILFAAVHGRKNEYPHATKLNIVVNHKLSVKKPDITYLLNYLKNKDFKGFNI